MFSGGIEIEPMIGREGESLTVTILDCIVFDYSVDLEGTNSAVARSEKTDSQSWPNERSLFKTIGSEIFKFLSKNIMAGRSVTVKFHIIGCTGKGTSENLKTMV